MAREIKIGNRMVGDGHPAYVIAEIGINHNGDIEIAKQIIDAAVHAGVDAVKFQKRTPDVATPPNNKNKCVKRRGATLPIWSIATKWNSQRSNITRLISSAKKEIFHGWFQCGMSPRWTLWKTLILPRIKFRLLRSRIINY